MRLSSVGLPFRALLAIITIVLCLATGDAAVAEPTLAERHRALEEAHAQALAQLADWCATQRLTEEASLTHEWIPTRAPLTLRLALVPEESDAVPANLSREWQQRFKKLRSAQGIRLFELAQEAVAATQYTLAFQLTYETLREDPSHEQARRLLGYRLHDGQWLTPYEIGKRQAHQVWHPQFGWLPQAQVERYEAGERYYKHRWLSAADEAILRADIDQGWKVETEHYEIRTNHSLEEGVRLAGKLEQLYQVWRQVFLRFHRSDDQLAKLFRDGAPPNRSPRRHRVTYYRDRAEYVAALEPSMPNIGISTGFYFGDSRTAYFFVGEDSDLYHEATHQLFNETRPVAKQPGADANFWVVEGVACFMESFAPTPGGAVVLGGADAIRLDNARGRLLRDDYVPLAELTGMGIADVQRHPQISMLYSESSGLTYFMLFAADGRYREALVDYLVAVYTHRDRPETLAELTDSTYSELDAQYRQFIQRLP
jgi:hypothetical protein